jgi:RHS repeat-associated protein
MNTPSKREKQEGWGAQSNSLPPTNARDNSEDLRSPAFEFPTLNLPKGGGAIRGIEENLQVNSVMGTASVGIPIPFSRSRGDFVPGVGFGYNSGNGNSAFGLGWNIGIPTILRKSENLLPQYKDEEESDTFVISGNEDLVPLLEKNGAGWKRYKKPRVENGISYTVSRYRPRVEGAFTLIEKWQDDATGETHWRTIASDNVHSYFGVTTDSRISDPNDPTRIFEWKLCRSHDDKGNVCIYEYKEEDFTAIDKRLNEKNRKSTQTYIKKIFYGNRKPYYLGDAIPGENDFLFKAIFDYGEHDSSPNVPKDIDVQKNPWTCRKDPFSNCRAGFEVRTYRRCSRVLMFHCFDQPELPHSPYLVKSLELIFDEDLDLIGSGKKVNGFSYLMSIRQKGHKWNPGTNSYTTKFLPEIELTYQQHEWDQTVKQVTEQDAAHAPIGIKDRQYLWVDLFSEGISGILTEQAGSWFYKSNLGDGNFSQAVAVSPKPNLVGLSAEKTFILDLEGDGAKYLVQNSLQPKGFFKLTDDDQWEPFRHFETFPNFDLFDPKSRILDLTGDGIGDVVSTEENALVWYRGKGEKGFDLPRMISKEIDEEKGPAIIFADRTQSIFLADMNGDGLTDIVRIRNGEACYWANQGYGKFSAKVSMDNAPFFDHPDTFNPRNLRLADIDGSGTIDVIYLGKTDFRVWLNLNGNEWSAEPQIISSFPEINDLSEVSVLDFLGTGTAAIVISSPLPTKVGRPLQYIDLLGSKKPHLLVTYQNNCGKTASLEYKPSTHFYLEDKKEGRKWITKLPFPVHCISKLRSEDKVSGTVFTSSYRYSHGYFDHAEKEFRGFGRVEQLDAEEFERFKLNDAKNVVEERFHQAPAKTISWFHTGAFLRKEKVLHQCRSEYFQNTEFNEYDLPEPIIADDLSTDELREAWRALKGLPLRMETYAEDDSLLTKIPYAAGHSNVEIRRIQPKESNKYASFLIVPSETIAYAYERDASDPRVSHTFVLETDEYGNELRSASVIYPRVKRPVPPDEIPDKVWDEQNKLHVVYGESVYTNDAIDDAKSVHRLRVGYESRSYEIAGFAPPASFFFTKQAIRDGIDNAGEILFEEEFAGGFEKRLSTHHRSYFLKDDLTAPLPLGELSFLGIGHKSYNLAFTKNLVTKHYGTKVTDQMLIDAKYVHSEGDDHWWTQSGTVIYSNDPKGNFYTPIGGSDVFGNQSLVEYDAFTLLAKSTTDAIGNTITADYDYRTLAPVMMTDPNLNRTAVETDELGMVIKTAVMGKAGAGEGDTLADPTTRLEYDLFNWKDNQKPIYVRVFAREKHGAANPRWQESYVYSDGGGSTIMTKVQAEAGKALIWNAVTKQLDEKDADPRWVGNGRTIVNNKGNPIKQFDPYFSTTHEYESEDALVETGFTPLLFYDPLGRNHRTEYPDGTFTKAEFGSWYFRSYDANDTVKDSQWYIDRGSPDPDLDPEPTEPEQRAAWLAAKHYNTPTTAHTNALGNSFYGITDYGNGKTTYAFSETDLAGRYSFVFDQKERRISESYSNMLGAAVHGRTAEKGEQWLFNDVMGRLVRAWDNDLREYRTTFDALHRPVSCFVKEGGSEFLFNHVLYGDDFFSDAAAQSQNLKGRAFRIFDQAGCITIRSVDFKGNPLQLERRLAKDYKARITDWKILGGITDLPTIDNTADSLLESEAFSGACEVDALNRSTKITMHGGTVFQPLYNEANLLDSLQVQLQGQGQFLTFLEGQDYDAKGQRQFAKYGNGTITEYSYDPKTRRLINLRTKLTGGDPNAQAIQNLNYTFDSLGNITQVRDDAQQRHFFANSVVYPESKYEYDAGYQLVKATGREHAGLGGNAQRSHLDIPFIAQLPHANDANAVRNYSELYEYDDCGNIKKMQHIALNANWTKRYRYEYEDDPTNNTNRLKGINAPGDAEDIFSMKYFHDLHGNMTSMPHLSVPNSLIWSFSDQLKEVDLGGGGKAYYVYGSGGKRIRKVIERPGGTLKERIYLGAIEIYRERQGDSDPTLERQTIHVSDNAGRIAQVDIKTIDTNDSDPSNPINSNLIRYQYGNYLGSAVLETDHAGNIISYEEYHPYGTSAYRVSKSNVDYSLKRYRFSGKERDDETGFYYFGARYYAAWLGRWTSADPAGFASGFNQYRYCSNDPIMFADPTGTKDTYSIPHHFTGKESLQDIRAFLWQHGRVMSEPSVNESNYKDRYTPGPGKEGEGGTWRFDTRLITPQETFESAYPAPKDPHRSEGIPGGQEFVKEAATPEAGSVKQEARARVNEPRTFTPGEKLNGPYNLWSNEPGGGLKDAAKKPGYIMEDTALEDAAEAIAKRLGYTGRYDPRIASNPSHFQQIWEPTSDALAIRAGLAQQTVTSNGLEPTRVPPHPNPSGTVQASREIPRIQLAGGLMAQLGKVSGILTIVASAQIDNPLVKYTGIAAGALEYVAGSSYLIGVMSVGSTMAPSTVSALMTFGRVGGRIGGGVGMIVLSGYSLAVDIEQGEFGVAFGDAAGVVAGGAVLAGSGIVAGIATGVMVTNYAGNWVEKQVTPSHGRTAGVGAGVAAGAALGAGIGAAIGVWGFGVAAVPAAAVGALIGGAAGFIGAYW